MKWVIINFKLVRCQKFVSKTISAKALRLVRNVWLIEEAFLDSMVKYDETWAHLFLNNHFFLFYCPKNKRILKVVQSNGKITIIVFERNKKFFDRVYAN